MKKRYIIVLLAGLFCCINLTFASDTKFSSKKEKGSVGIGLNGISDWSSQFPFLDLMKQGREWFDWNQGSTKGIALDKHGWVTSIARGVRPETVFLTTNEGAPIVYKHYIVRWEGKGRVSYGGCARKVGSAHGGDRIVVGENECFLGLDAVDESDPIRNITIVPEKHVDAFDRGEIFNPDFIEKIQQFRALRFMDWMNTNGSEQQYWADRPHPDDRSYVGKGVPVEVMIQLANKVMADPWFNMPHKADSEYIKAFSGLVKTQLNPELRVYVEYSNETWNWIFSQTRYALEMAKKQFGVEGDAFMQWNGMRTAQMCDIWKRDVFGDSEERIVCVLGAQLGWPGLEQAALDCPLWVKQGNKPCVDHGIDVIAVAGYFSGCLNGGEDKRHQALIIEWAKQQEKGLQKAYEQVLDGRYFECEDSLTQVKKHYEYFAKQAKKRGLSVAAYEGGQHITSNLGETQDDERFSALHIKLNRSQYMKGLYEVNFTHWKEAGGSLFMHFVDASQYSKHGSWGALEYITQETSPKWEALLQFNQTPCWWEDCAL